MTLVPKHTVPNQVAEQIRRMIDRNNFHIWLPNERLLCRMTQVGRNTVRKALSQLKSEGSVSVERGVGYRILHPSTRSGSKSQLKSIAILIPTQFAMLRPFVSLWIDELKDLLTLNNCTTTVYESPRFYKKNPANALEHLALQNSHDLWLLVLSSHATQLWFVRSRLPCFIAGSAYSGIGLSSLDVDYRAICRHAVGVLYRLGHRRIALFGSDPQRAGDLESEIGFLDGIKSLGLKREELSIFRNREDDDSLRHSIDRIFAERDPATALIVCNSYSYLTVTSLLALRNIRIPNQMSIISRDDDPFLQFLRPLPARYLATPKDFAMKLLTPVLRLAAHVGDTTPHHIQILPKFARGDSIAMVCLGSLVDKGPARRS